MYAPEDKGVYEREKKKKIRDENEGSIIFVNVRRTEMQLTVLTELQETFCRTFVLFVRILITCWTVSSCFTGVLGDYVGFYGRQRPHLTTRIDCVG